MTKAKTTTPPSKTSPSVTLPPLWTRYQVDWQFLTRICGSVPAAPELVQRWLEARAPSVKPAGGKSIQEINEEVLATLTKEAEAEADEQYSMLTFQRHQGQLVLRYGTVRAHLKDCARQLSTLYTGKIQGEKSFAVRVINGLYLDETEYWLPIRTVEGEPLTESSGFFDKAARAWTPRGMVSFLKRIEYVEPPTLVRFTLKLLGEAVKEDDLHLLFQYGGTHGYGGERGDGEGRYHYTLTRLGN